MKPWSRPAAGRPKGLALTTAWQGLRSHNADGAPSRGLLNAICLGRKEADPRGGASGVTTGLLSGIEERSDVLGGLLILARDGIGVVTGHVHSRPAEASLLLTLGNDRVE
jgi:hypothetical protein